MVDADDAVVLLEEALLLRLAPPLQTLDQQAQSPARAKEAREPAWGRLGSGTASTLAPSTRAAAGSAPTLQAATPGAEAGAVSRYAAMSANPGEAVGTPTSALGRAHPGEFLPFSHI